MGECEKILRDNNEDIPDSEQLIIYKTDIKTEDLSSTYVIYEVYHPLTLQKLNLSLCSEVKISIDIPVSLDNNMEELYNRLSDSGYNLFNENDSFYQDICSTYTSVNGTDILLSDRKKDFYGESQNISVCQNGCRLESYNSKTKKAKCNCSLEEESKELNDLNIEDFFTREAIQENFYKTLSNSNFKVLKCYQLLLSSKIIKNVGEIVMTIIFVTFLILVITHIFTGKKRMIYYINLILKKKLNNQKIAKKKTKTNKKEKINKNSSISIKNTSQKSFFSIRKKKNHAPPKKLSTKQIDLTNEGNSHKKLKALLKNPKKSGNYYQNNIYLNVNVIKNKKKKIKQKKIKK